MRAILLIFIVSLSPIHLWAASLTEILHPFVKVNEASGVVVRSWSTNGKNYAVVLSAEHVIRKIGDKTKVGTDFLSFDQNGKQIHSIKLFGRVLLEHQALDYAILYYETPHLYPACESAPVSRKLVVGEKVWAVGAPNRQYYWVSTGVISSLIIPRLDNHIGHSAGIYFGSSGGPLFDDNGVLIGVNVRLSAGPERQNGEQGDAITYLGFSIPLTKIYEHIGEKQRKIYFGH